MSAVTTSITYHREWFAEFFHDFPHVDFSFEKTDSTFNPEDARYREALGFWAGIPLILCALLWIAFLIFFCLRCCGKSQSQRKQGKAVCPCFFGAFFLLLSCGALAVTFYGNAEVHSGTNDFVDAVKSVNRTVKESLQICDTLDRTADDAETKGIPALTKAVEEITNVTVRTKISEYIKKIESNIDTAKTKLVSLREDAEQVNTEEITNRTEDVELYRFPVTSVIYGLYVIIFLLTFVGLLKKSKWMLILSAVFSIICMVTIWGTTSAYLFLAVGAGDLCVDPDSFVINRMNGTVNQDVLLAFVKCADSSQPFQGGKEQEHADQLADKADVTDHLKLRGSDILRNEILDAQTAVTQAITALNLTVNISKPFNISDKLSGPVNLVRNDLKSAFGNLSSLATLVGSCNSIHNDYILAVKGVCNTALEGIAYLVLFSAVVGICSALLVLCTAFTWPYYNRRGRCRNRGYTPVDDTDPFLPDPPPYEQNYGSIRHPTQASAIRPAGSIGVSEDDRAIMNLRQVGESPPPAYQPGHFIQQYSNLAPRPSSVASSPQPIV